MLKLQNPDHRFGDTGRGGTEMHHHSGSGGYGPGHVFPEAEKGGGGIRC